MKSRSIIVLTLILLATVANANTANKRLQSMSESERQKALTGFMTTSGENCAVIKTFYQGSTKTGDALWNVQCKTGKAYSVLIKNDAQGSTKIMDCAVLKKINAGECFKKYN